MDKKQNKDKQWKRDFPLQRTRAMEVTRRDFAKFLCLVSGGLAVGNGFVAGKAVLSEEETIAEQFICEKGDIPVGGTKSFVIKNSTVPYILIHLEDGTFTCYEQKCTHLACAVFYKPNTGKIECPCHNGWFDARTGEVLQGPPPRALPRLQVVTRGDKIYVKSMQEKTS